MLRKTTFTDDYADMPGAVLLPHYSKGVDRNILHKRASVLEDIYSTIKPKAGHHCIHLISVADGDYYGPNTRADYYVSGDGEHTTDTPEDGASAVVQLHGGLKKYHDVTFMRDGAVYREHHNREEGAQPLGSVLAAKYNEPMHRGELIIEIPLNGWETDIDDLSNGKQLCFSIGAGAPYDICSICHHVARTEEGHCDHYKLHRNKIDDQGRRAFVITDNMAFHDISRVRNPAEKIALSLRKVANANGLVVPSDSVNVDSLKYFLPPAGLRRFETLKKLAAIEKIINAVSMPAEAKAALPALAMSSRPPDGDLAYKRLQGIISTDIPEVVMALQDKKAALPPGDFARLVLGDDEWPESNDNQLAVELQDGFGRLLNGSMCGTDGLEDVLNDSGYTPKMCGGEAMRLTPKACGRCCLSANDLLPEILNAVSNNLTPPRIVLQLRVGPKNTGIAAGVAKEYLSYLLSQLEGYDDSSMTMALIRQLLLK